MNRRGLGYFFRTSLTVVFIAAFAGITFGQFRAAIQGTVMDTSGGVVPEATVTLTNTETGRTSQTTTNDSGFYRFSGLEPGKYRLSAEKASYKKALIEGVTVSAEVLQGLDLVLAAGAISETVTVTAENTGIQTEDSNIETNISNRQILKLPQVGRDPYELARLASGVFGAGARGSNGSSSGLPNTTGPGGSNSSIFQTENQVPITANGQRLSANNFQIDGVSVNSQTWGGAAVVTPSQESVEEVKISSSTYSAENGRNSGALIQVISKQGNNSLHGSAFFKYTGPELNAFNTFPDSRQKVLNKSQQFGGSIGGRLIKDKLFYFFTYEGFRSSSDVPFRAWIETEQYRNLVKSVRSGGVTARIFNSPGIEPRINLIIPQTCAQAGIGSAECQMVSGGLDIGSPRGALRQYVPFSAFTGNGFDGIPDIVFAELANPGKFRGHQFAPRLDFNATEKDSFSWSAFFTPTKNVGSDTAGRSRPMNDIISKRLNWATALIYRRTISATMYNEARFNITRWGFDEIASNPDTNFGIPRVEVEGLPFDRIRFGVNRSEGTPGDFIETQWDLRDTFTWVKQNHVLKFGAEFRRELNDNSIVGGARPLYSFVRLWNLANDTPIFEAWNADPSTGAPAEGKRNYRSWDYSFFVQDDWKVKPNLTFNLGLRYELFTPLRDSAAQQSNLIFGSNGLANAKVVVVDNLHKTDKNNFGPQIGFAWSPGFLKTKGVIRGGFGIGYNRLPNAIFLNSRGNPPFFARFNICCGTAGPTGGDGFGTPFVDGQIAYVLGSSNSPLSYPGNPILGAGIDPATGAPVNGSVEIYGSPEDQPNAQIFRYSLEGQYELPYKVTATLGYQGSRTKNLVRLVNQNFVNAVTNPKFFAVYFPTPDVKANYNAMNFRLDRRFADGVQVTGSYRFSKSIDNLSYEGPGAVTNQTFPVDNATERGRSDFDVKHSFNLYGNWDLPIFRSQKDLVGKLLGGWNVSGIWTWHSGFPWTPKVDTGLRSLSTGNFFGPIRPIAYFGGNGNSTSNSTFLSPNGNFPGNTTSTDCGAGTGCSRYFLTTVRRDGTGEPLYSLNVPGIGRNIFNGPRYRSLDLSITKKFGLADVLGFKEGAGIEIRANLFNALNKLNLAPFGFFDDSVIINRPRFGQATNALAGRVGELQVRFNF